MDSTIWMVDQGMSGPSWTSKLTLAPSFILVVVSGHLLLAMWHFTWRNTHVLFDFFETIKCSRNCKHNVMVWAQHSIKILCLSLSFSIFPISSELWLMSSIISRSLSAKSGYLRNPFFTLELTGGFVDELKHKLAFCDERS